MRNRLAVLTMILFSGARAASGQQAQLGASWGGTLNGYKLGRVVTFICPPNGNASSVWGNGPYSADSSVCTAAVHAGLITLAGGGVVTVTVGEGRKAFTGSTSNGITTLSYGEFPSTFSFAKERDGGEINWNTTARGLTTSINKPLVLRCPSGGKVTDVVYGTDTYTDDSPICVAAVHAGLIDAEKGGSVTVSPENGLASYSGSARNGVTTTTFGPWSASFKFGNSIAATSATAGPFVFRLPTISVVGMEPKIEYVFRLKEIVVAGEAVVPKPYVFRLAPIVVEGLH